MPEQQRAALQRADPQRPVGTVTRGTTNPNRLRRIDRWLAGPAAAALRTASDPLVVDLGYGASPVTTLELADRLAGVRPDVEVLGLEIDRERVRAAQQALAGRTEGSPRVRFAHGGFELGPAATRRPVMVRAANVLRQYEIGEVLPAWRQVTTRLARGGLLVDATCDELGRRAAWMAVGSDGPLSLTLSLRLRGLQRPSDVAERLPKVLIHRNVPGEAVHAWLQGLDEAWVRAAVVAPFGVRQRFLATCHAVREAGWPVLGGPARWRLGEVSVAWSAVAPSDIEW